MIRLTTEEILYLFDEQLPALLDEYPDLEPRLYHAFLKAFARKEEVVALQKEVTEFRSETQANFERADQRLEEFQTETRSNFEQADRRLEEFQAETQSNFERVDRRFEEFQAETRSNFERVDRRFEEFQAETRSNFEQVDQRFEQVDQRFEQVDQRFEQVDQRFEQVDQRFESLETRITAGFREMRQLIGGLGSRWGIYNESLFRQTIASLLTESFGVQVEKQIIEGEEFDILIFDGAPILVEITARAKSTIQRRLERKRDLYTQATGVRPARIILAVGSIHSTRAQALREAGFEVIEPEEDVEDW